MPLCAQAIESLLEKNIPGCRIDLKDLAGDNDHFQMLIVADQFKGLSRIKRHQLVYEALEGKMGTQLHALSFKTLTPDEKASS